MLHNDERPKLTLVTAIIVAACLGMHLLILLTGIDATSKFGLSSWQFGPEGNFIWGILLIVLHAFVHQDWAHLIGNMLFLIAFGSILEYHLGSKRFAYLFFTGVIVSGIYSLAVHPSPQPDSGQAAVALIGASGGISAVIAAVLLSAPRATFMELAGYVIPSWLIAVLYFLYQASQLSAPGAMYDSVGIHLIGALAGFSFVIGMMLRGDQVSH